MLIGAEREAVFSLTTTGSRHASSVVIGNGTKNCGISSGITPAIICVSYVMQTPNLGHRSSWTTTILVVSI